MLLFHTVGAGRTTVSVIYPCWLLYSCCVSGPASSAWCEPAARNSDTSSPVLSSPPQTWPFQYHTLTHTFTLFQLEQPGLHFSPLQSFTDKKINQLPLLLVAVHLRSPASQNCSWITERTRESQKGRWEERLLLPLQAEARGRGIWCATDNSRKVINHSMNLCVTLLHTHTLTNQHMIGNKLKSFPSQGSQYTRSRHSLISSSSFTRTLCKVSKNTRWQIQ